jgi:hypothetical protein
VDEPEVRVAADGMGVPADHEVGHFVRAVVAEDEVRVLAPSLASMRRRCSSCL